jgi:hypothetical protein
MMDADRNADGVEELRSNNGRLLAALKELLAAANDLEHQPADLCIAIDVAEVAIKDAEAEHD